MPDRNGHFDAAEREVLEAVMSLRRDVRGNRFTDQPVCEETINRIIDAGLCAPSVGYSQPWDFVVVRDRGTRQRIRDCYEAENDKARAQFEGDRAQQYRALKLEGIVEAPVNIAVFYRPSDEPILGQTSMREVGLYSVVCAVQNMWLMARALNVGVGWVSILDPERVKAIVNAPDDAQLVAYLCVGRVDRFEEQPELERLGWEQRKRRASVVHGEYFRADCKTAS